MMDEQTEQLHAAIRSADRQNLARAEDKARQEAIEATLRQGITLIMAPTINLLTALAEMPK